MLKNFLQLTRKQKIITIVVYTVIAAITMYLGYNIKLKRRLFLRMLLQDSKALNYLQHLTIQF